MVTAVHVGATSTGTVFIEAVCTFVVWWPMFDPRFLIVSSCTTVCQCWSNGREGMWDTFFSLSQPL